MPSQALIITWMTHWLPDLGICVKTLGEANIASCGCIIGEGYSYDDTAARCTYLSTGAKKKKKKT